MTAQRDSADPAHPGWGPVQTFSGPIPAAELGVTLIHEHLFVRDPELELNVHGLEWDRGAAVEQAVVALTKLHAAGVRTVVDLTVVGLGRDIELVAEVAARIPLQLVASTGLYGAAGLPLFFEFHGPGRLVNEPEPLADLFVRDIEEGIAGSAVRAAMIKITSVGSQLSESEQRVMSAAALAHQRCGVPITTHSVPALRNGLLQQDFLRDHGVSLERVIIGHCGDSDDLDYLCSLMDVGSTIGMDRFGMEHVLPDRTRIDTVVELVGRGYADRMVLSHDAAIYSHVTPPSWRAVHAPRWHMSHLLDDVVPELRARGVSAVEIDRMLIANPARLLAPGEGGAP